MAEYSRQRLLLRTALALSAVGVVVTWGLIIGNALQPISTPLPVFVTLPWALVAFLLALWNHPRHPEFKVGRGLIWRTAPKWCRALMYLTLAVFFGSGVMLTIHGTYSFTIARSALVGHPGRFRLCAATVANFQVAALQTSLSGLTLEKRAPRAALEP